MASPNSISPKQLLRLIGTPNAPVLFDVCLNDDFEEDPYLIPASIRHPATDLQGLLCKISGRSVVIICQKGKKLSQGVVSWLRGEGHQAEYLEGGMHAWRDIADAPRVPATRIPDRIGGHTLWVTRHRPKIDRIACPWLIRRFVDPDAKFLFVAPGEVESVATAFGASPFDIENTFWSHRGDNCTFDTMLDEFELHSPALDRLATVIRAADTNRHALAPEAAGLLAVSVGLSRQYRDDHENLKAGMNLYDAMYRWARDGFDESHDWPTGRTS
ncbi:sulfurtransferase/chromate resistance protein [Ruegeria sp. HKCCD6119]|uniref:chromate resistance protein ChrB domain-containing protein n=1 Tax=Ruegeria sp. HKCCD6119 TaxID=2683003 RepID=UPI001491122E|nr:sulfurtransferase/chromate resistance protein [Ruegeria sp. HKCCD6119]NOD83488.1 sulfurtransferase [Ruegeria sp. HKCCD6119]